MSTTMSVLYPVPLDKLKSQDQLNDTKIVIKSENSSPPPAKKSKFNSLSSQNSTEIKPVLTQISMNQQQQPANQKQRKRRVSDGSSKVKPPPGVAVARRNARERNRVKQVNNGFSLLRDHIPPEISENYEQSNRGGAKKLSKVETLKMAVEYIRNLEKMLSFDSSLDSMPSSPTNTTFANLSESSLPATPPPEIPQQFFYALKPHANLLETEITIVNGQQYVRIPGTNTFQLVTPEMFENEENIHPSPSEFTTIQIHPPSSSSPQTALPSLMIQPTGGLMSGGQTPSLNSFVSEINSSTSIINSSETPAGSISPYSGHSSLSPAPSHHTDNISSNGNNIMIEEGRFSIAKRPKDVYNKHSTMSYAEHLMINNDTSHYDNLILKQEIVHDDTMFDESSLSNENMMEAMQWWDHQQSLEHSTTP